MAASGKKKVVVTTRLYAPEVGAAAFRLKALVEGLLAEGAEVEVITTKPPRGSGTLNASYRVSRWPVLRDAGGNVRGYIQYLSFDVPAFFRLVLAEADVVVSEPPPTTGVVVALSSKILRRPYVYYAADIWTEALSAMQVSGVVKKVLGAVEGRVLRNAAKVIAVSDPVGRQVEEFRVPESAIDVVGNGVDVEVFALEGTKPPVSNPYFVYTGTMSEWQGAEVFIQALAVLRRTAPDIELRFFGQGTDEPNLKEVAASLGLSGVHFGGVVPPAEAAEWIRGAAAALVSIKPGQGYDFAKPTKVYAAAACGTPVIFAGTGEGADMVSAGRLGVASEYTAESVAKAMGSILADDSLEGSQSRQARHQWVLENASLQAAGRTAAKAVLQLLN